jgi:CheY-like chemotaxis protein
LLVCSQDLCDIFGTRSPDDMVGQNVLRFLADDSHDQSIASLLSGGEGVYGSTGRKLDGRTFPIQIGSIPIRFRGGEARMVTVRDLSPLAVVVDDEAPVARMTALLMQGAGYQVVKYTSSRQALADYEYSTASVIVSDVKMPELDGITMVEQIRRLDPGLPVIFMSGYTTDPIPQDAATAFVGKPFGVRDLERALKGLPERARATLD